MKIIFYITIFLVSSLFSMNLEEIINASLSNNPSLETIEKRLDANKENIKLSREFENPEILLSTNTLDSSQAMSQTVVTLKQKIPFYNKRDLREDVATAEDKILQQKLENAKVALVGLIKKEAYTIWELQELHKIIDKYLELTQKSIDLYTSYSGINSTRHMGIMRAELSLSELKIQKNKIESKIDSAYARLSYLAAIDIETLDIKLEMGEKPNLVELMDSFSTSPQVQLQEKELEKERAKLAKEIDSVYPDINLLAGYSYREKFDDYMNIGLGLSIPLYSNEEYKTQQQRLLLLSNKSKKEDIENSLKSEIKGHYSQMLLAYKTYDILQNEALVKLSHMFELSQSSIATGEELFKYIALLFIKLKLEKESIESVSNYKQSQARLAQLRGEIK